MIIGVIIINLNFKTVQNNFVELFLLKYVIYHSILYCM